MEGPIEAVYQPLASILDFKEWSLTTSGGPQRQEDTDVIYLGTINHRVITLEDSNMYRFVVALQFPHQDKSLDRIKRCLDAEDSGEILKSRYPFVPFSKWGDSRMLILEGKGNPEFLREQIEGRLRELYGDRFAFSEEELTERF